MPVFFKATPGEINLLLLLLFNTCNKIIVSVKLLL